MLDETYLEHFPTGFESATGSAFERWWEEDVGRPYHLVINEDKVGFPAVHIESDFKRPVKFGDPYDIILLDEDGRECIDFGVYAAPETFLVDSNGTIVFKHIGALTEEVIAEEIVRTVVGSIGLVLAAPITSLIASLLAHWVAHWRVSESMARLAALRAYPRCCTRRFTSSVTKGAGALARRSISALARATRVSASA